MTLYHIILFLFSIFGREFSNLINRGFWPLKILGIIVGYIVFLIAMPNKFFDGFREFSRVISAFYLIPQLIVLIDFMYVWNEKWVWYYDSRNESFLWIFLLFLVSAIMWVISIASAVLSYWWFGYLDCGANIFLITLPVVLGVAYTIISFSPLVFHGSLLTSSAVNLYVMWMTWSALSQNPISHGNSWDNDASSAFLLMYSTVGIVFTLLYLSFRKIPFGYHHGIRDHFREAIAHILESDDSER